ncbi:MAG: AlbA family DNA-binding domain-containing protein, partial [Acidimicrobiales bacterium]
MALPPSEGYGQITLDRQGSGNRTWFEPLGWATAEARMPANWNPQQPEPMRMLLSDNAPSFVTFYAAAASFFWVDRQPAGGQISPTVTYRHADTSGRISLVRIEHDRVCVQVEGSEIDGMTVELAGDVPGPRQVVESRGERTAAVEFPILGGLPSGAWVVLKSSSRWVDRHFLTHPFRREAEGGVEWVIEPTTRLEGLLSGRERLGVEFKREVPRSDESKLRMMKTVAAFANGNGGSILVGVNDDREVVGIPKAAAARAIDTLTEMVGRWVTPPPRHSFQELAVGDDGERVVLELVVAQGTHLYGAGKPGETPLVYVRPYSTTERAWPSE